MRSNQNILTVRGMIDLVKLGSSSSTNPWLSPIGTLHHIRVSSQNSQCVEVGIGLGRGGNHADITESLGNIASKNPESNIIASDSTEFYNTALTVDNLTTLGTYSGLSWTRNRPNPLEESTLINTHYTSGFFEVNRGLAPLELDYIAKMSARMLVLATGKYEELVAKSIKEGSGRRVATLTCNEQGLRRKVPDSVLGTQVC